MIMFKFFKKMFVKRYMVTYEFDGAIYTHTATSAAIANIDADPYATILKIKAL